MTLFRMRLGNSCSVAQGKLAFDCIKAALLPWNLMEVYFSYMGIAQAGFFRSHSWQNLCS